MKKTLAAVAILGAFAGSAMADVTVYGKLDMGLGYTNLDGAESVEMKSGVTGASRFGLKGTEKIGEDLTVGFNYEFGLDADTGVVKHGDNQTRVSALTVKGSWGEILAGRYGTLDSGTGPADFVAGMSALGTGWYSDLGGQQLVMHTDACRNNVITYKAPAFGGLTVAAQVASGESVDAGKEFSHDSDMYYGVAAKYQAGAFGAAAVVTVEDWDNTEAKTRDAAVNVTAGVNYNFGFATAYLAANYYEDGTDGHDQYGVVASVKAPVAGGTMTAEVGYGEGSNQKSIFGDKATAEDVTNTFVAATYLYPLSKQTSLYGAAGWHQEEADEVTTDVYKAAVGIVHNF